MKRAHRHYLFLGVAVTLLAVNQNCSQPTDLNVSTEGATTVAPSRVDDDTTQSTHQSFELVLDDNDVICDPLGYPTSMTSAESGLKAQLKYLRPSEPRPSSAMDYFNDNVGVSIQKSIFFQSVSTFARRFDTGFLTSAGELLKDTDGNTLIEYFGIQYSSLLRLAPPGTNGVMQPGNYELASISDDGSVLELDLKDGLGYRKLVDNDGTHSERLRCSSQSIRLSENQKLPLRYSYYQGPRYRISNLLLIRPASSTPEPYCQSTFAKYNGADDLFYRVEANQSVATTYFTALTQRGWRVIPGENFELPEGALNPCADLSQIIEIVDARIEMTSSQNNPLLYITYNKDVIIDIHVEKMNASNQWVLLQQFRPGNTARAFSQNLGSLADTNTYRVNLSATLPNTGRKLNTIYNLMRIPASN